MEPPPKSRIPADYIVGAVILLVCAILYGITLTFETVPPSLSQNVPPERFPQLILGVIAALTVVMMFQARKRPAKKRKFVPRTAVYTGTILILFMVVHAWLGTLVTMSLFLLALPILWGERRYPFVLIYAVLFPTAVYGLFVKILQVRFYWGIFEAFIR